MSEVTYIRCNFCEQEFPAPMTTVFRCDVRVVKYPDKFADCESASVREWEHMCEGCHNELFKAVDECLKERRNPPRELRRA